MIVREIDLDRNVAREVADTSGDQPHRQNSNTGVKADGIALRGGGGGIRAHDAGNKSE